MDFGSTSWNIGSKCCIHYLLDWGASAKRGGYFNLLLSVDESGTHLERLRFSFAGLFLKCDDVCQLPIWQVFWVSGSFTMFRNILPLTNPRCHHDCHCLLQTRHDSQRSRVNDFRKRCTKRAGLRRQKVMGVTLKMGITDAKFTI